MFLDLNRSCAGLERFASQEGDANLCLGSSADNVWYRDALCAL